MSNSRYHQQNNSFDQLDLMSLINDIDVNSTSLIGQQQIAEIKSLQVQVESLKNQLTERDELIKCLKKQHRNRGSSVNITTITQIIRRLLKSLKNKDATLAQRLQDIDKELDPVNKIEKFVLFMDDYSQKNASSVTRLCDQLYDHIKLIEQMTSDSPDSLTISSANAVQKLMLEQAQKTNQFLQSFPSTESQPFLSISKMLNLKFNPQKRMEDIAKFIKGADFTMEEMKMLLLQEIAVSDLLRNYSQSLQGNHQSSSQIQQDQKDTENEIESRLKQKYDDILSQRERQIRDELQKQYQQSLERIKAELAEEMKTKETKLLNEMKNKEAEFANEMKNKEAKLGNEIKNKEAELREQFNKLKLNLDAERRQMNENNQKEKDQMKREFENQAKSNEKEAQLLRDNLEQEIRKELEPKIYKEVEFKIKSELEQQNPKGADSAMRQNIEPQMREEIRKDLEPRIRNEIRNELEPKMREEIRNELEPRIRNDLNSQIRSELVPQLQRDLEPQIRSEIENRIMKTIKGQSSPYGSFSSYGQTDTYESIANELRDKLKSEIENETRKIREQLEHDNNEALNSKIQMLEKEKNEYAMKLQKELENEKQRLRSEIEYQVKHDPNFRSELMKEMSHETREFGSKSLFGNEKGYDTSRGATNNYGDMSTRDASNMYGEAPYRNSNNAYGEMFSRGAANPYEEISPRGANNNYNDRFTRNGYENNGFIGQNPDKSAEVYQMICKALYYQGNEFNSDNFFASIAALVQICNEVREHFNIRTRKLLPALIELEIRCQHMDQLHTQTRSIMVRQSLIIDDLRKQTGSASWVAWSHRIYELLYGKDKPQIDDVSELRLAIEEGVASARGYEAMWKENSKNSISDSYDSPPRTNKKPMRGFYALND